MAGDDLSPLDGVYRISEAVVSRELDGEAIILNLDSGIYFGLDPVGTRIWQLMSSPGRVSDVLRVLLAEYDVSEEVLRADLGQLITKLIEKGLVVQVDAPETAA